MSEKTMMSLYEEIVKIRQLLEMSVKDNLRKELEKVLTTKERKMVWALSDGLTDTKTIAEKTRISQRAVQGTLKELQDAELMVVEKRGFPKRKFDYVPSDWKYKEEDVAI
jgi:DNA-binding transcriptional ArsR family regulator